MIRPDYAPLDVPTIPSGEIQPYLCRDIRLIGCVSEYFKGDTHVRSVFSTHRAYQNRYPEGLYTPVELLTYAQKVGLDFVCFTEHASNPGWQSKQHPEGPICTTLRHEAAYLRILNSSGILRTKALGGVETNILSGKKPSLDIPEAVLDHLDLVLASLHTAPNSLTPKQIRKALLYAAEHEGVDILAHPDRNIQGLQKRYPAFWERMWDDVLEAMIKTQKCFEINLKSKPSIDLIKKIADSPVRITIGSDTHELGTRPSEPGHEQYDQQIRKVKDAWAKERATADENKLFQQYKHSQLNASPDTTFFQLLRVVARLESYPVAPGRVMNRSMAAFLTFLTGTRGKSTANLEYLKSVS